MEQTYDVAKAIEAQKEYCKEYAAKHPEDWMAKDMSEGKGFAPVNGICYCCHQQIYAESGAEGVWRGRRGLITSGRKTHGISVERARKELTTGCPFCHRSYVD